MKQLYVADESISASISYFRNLNITSGEQLGMFFFCKRKVLGVF